MGGKCIDMTGQYINEWEVISYAGSGYWNCRCSCGVEKKVRGYELRHGETKSCGHLNNFSNKFIDLTGQCFGEWKALRFLGDDKWECRCSCGKVAIVSGWGLRHGETKSCGHPVHLELIGKKINEWKVLSYAGSGRFNCECSCGRRREVPYYHLVNGNSKSCGHSKLKDLTNQVFGELTVIRYTGNGYWECECSCNGRIIVSGVNLRGGSTRSCGCKSQEIFRDTMIERYGVTSYAKIPEVSGRSDGQLKMIETKQNLIDAINNNFSEKPSTLELSLLLGINESNTLKYIHRYKLEEYVDLGYCWVSNGEKEIFDLFPGGIQSDRKTLKGKELDILYKDVRLAIEFNGSYWHSEIYKGEKEHQTKSIECRAMGIRLIHIFEYEWNNSKQRDKLTSLLDSILKPENNRVIPGRKCRVAEIDSTEARVFLDSYHLQGYAPAKINIGLYNHQELLGIMTFGTSRYDKSYEYELIRLCWKSGTVVIGGSDKLFKYFISKYNITSIVSYCDLSKFTGSIYDKLGFRFDSITRPGYVWFNNHNKKICSRYDSMKHKLIKAGLGDKSSTESEIMARLGYIRIYDSGNLKYVWNKK